MKLLLLKVMATLAWIKVLQPSLRVWKFRLEERFEHATFFGLPRDYVLQDGQGNIIAGINTEGRVFAEAGFCWNGCDPKIRLGDIIIGTPDGAIHERTGKPKTYYASLTHDILCQLIKQYPDFPMTRAQADEQFKDRLIHDDFRQWQLYYHVVRWLGRPYGSLMDWVKGVRT